MSIDNNKGSARKSRAPKGLYPDDDLDFGDPPLPEIDDLEPKKNAARSDVRPAMREESPAERARKRAAEIRGHADLDEGTDEFYVPPDLIPDGWTYEWKRYSTYNQIDSSHIRELERKGWTFVPAARHPQLVAIGDSGNIILRKGLVLMERPTEIVEEARLIERRRAAEQVRSKEEQLAGTPEGTMTRDHSKARPQIKKSYEAIPIPDK